MNSYFPDVNVWIAAAFSLHRHHRIAREWLESVPDDRIFFCRFTQLAFLRLITNPAVMGEDLQTQLQAWSAYDSLLADDRIWFQPESNEIETFFRKLTSARRFSNRHWSDAYLAAFAKTENFTLVTFDRALHRMTSHSLLLA